MYPQFPLELVADPMVYAEHTLGATALECSYDWLLNHVTNETTIKGKTPDPQTLTDYLQGLVAVF